VAYDPDKHHRCSIRLKGHDYSDSGTYFITICAYQREQMFGAIVDGIMQLNELGGVVRSHWLNLPKYHPHLRLDEFVVMPNHMHGVLVLIDDFAGGHHHDASVVGADFDEYALGHHASVVGAGFDNHAMDYTDAILAKPAPTLPGNPMTKQKHSKRHGIPEIVRGFKAFSARRINRIREGAGTPVWQRNYYEHIVRDRTSLRYIRDYIRNNPRSWEEDQLHPDNPSKW
jgi:putative transposase